MIFLSEELYKQSEPSTPWIWNPAELAYDEDESSTSSQSHPYFYTPSGWASSAKLPHDEDEASTSSQSHQYHSYNRPWGSYTPWASSAKLPHDESSTSSQSHPYFYTPSGWASLAKLPHDEDESSTSFQSHQYYSYNTPWAPSAKFPHDEVSTSSQPYQDYSYEFKVMPPSPYSSHDPSPLASPEHFLSPAVVPTSTFPSEEFKSQSQSPPEDIQAPWITNFSSSHPPIFPIEEFDGPSTPPTPPTRAEPEAFTSKQDLRPTFGPNIIRTPRHYRRWAP